MDPFTRPAIFSALAGLFRPADPTIVWAVVEVDPQWSTSTTDIPEAEVLAWGRMPARGRPSPETVAFALRRELALGAVGRRPPRAMRVVAVQRLPPVRRPGWIRTTIRTATMSGAIVELARSELPQRRIDLVAARAGAAAAPRLRPSGDGSALARLTVPGTGEVELRLAVAGHGKDPLHGRAALQALEAAAVPHVPRPVDGDETAGVRWSTESVIVGDHPRTLDAALTADVVDLLARLPTGGPSPSSLADRMGRLADAFPRHAETIRTASAAAAAWADGLPTVMEHGDVWLNNLLVADGRVAGLIDWDTWHPNGVAGSDVLSLVAQDARAGTRREIGDLLVSRFWEAPAIREVVAAYGRARGIRDPDPAARAAMAIGWWATATATAMDRASRPASDPAWVQRNVDAPVATLEGLLATFR